MASIDELSRALVKADRAGDAQSARILAQEISRLRSQPAPMNVDPSEGMSNSEKFLAGMGKAFSDIGQGVGQIVPVRRNGQWDTLVTRDDVAETRKRDASLMNSGYATVGNVLGNIAVAAPTALIPGANTALGASAIGAGLGLLQPSTSTQETVVNTGLGAGGGYVGNKVGDALGRVMGGSRNAGMYQQAKVSGGKAGSSASASGSLNVRASGGGSGFGSVDPTDVGGLNPAQRSAMTTGKELGFQLTPGQASGSRALQQFEAKLESQPMTSGAFNAIKDSNQKTLNRIAAKAIGENDDVVDALVLQRAHDRIGSIYNMVATDKKAAINPDDFLGRLGQIETDYEGLLPASITDNPLVKRLYSFADKGEVTQKQLQDLASKLNKASYNQMTSASGDRQVGMALADVKDLVDDMLESNLSGKTLDAFREARGQYRNLMLLTQRQGVVNPSNGNVSGGSLASALTAKDKRGFVFNNNQSDLYNAARFAQAFKPIVGDSGTATRSMVNSPMDFAVSLPFNLAARAYTSAPTVGLAAGVSQGVAPQAFTPEMIRLLSESSRIGATGLLNSSQQ